jgi:hypothetical protein
MGDDEPYPSWAIGELIIPRYDHVRFYLDARLTSWENSEDDVCPLILLEITRDPLSMNRLIYIFKVLLRDKIRYVYADDMMFPEGTK